MSILAAKIITIILITVVSVVSIITAAITGYELYQIRSAEKDERILRNFEDALIQLGIDSTDDFGCYHNPLPQGQRRPPRLGLKTRY